MKKISLLGATGSIGIQTLDVIRNNKDSFQLVALSAGKNIDLVRKIAFEFQPEIISVQLKEDCDTLRTELPSSIKVYYGLEGMIEVATYHSSDILVSAVLGSVGLKPTLAAIKARKTIAIANKETLVTAGHIVTKYAAEYGVRLLPVDSEHSAIFQCLQGEENNPIDRLIITASGGSFRDRTREQLKNVTKLDALNHPNWSMGAKITIDSATMMNKGLEVIEAHWLFDLPYEQIDVLLHRESIIHSMVEFSDSSIKAQLGTPDMRVPIQYALTYPKRIKMQQAQKLDFLALGKLHFEEMNFERYQCLKMAYDAGIAGGSMPTVLNAANEIAVQAFLQDKIQFLDIDALVQKALDSHQNITLPSLEEIEFVDLETRKKLSEII